MSGRERERSQRRRAAELAAAEAAREDEDARERRKEQEALLRAIDDALPRSDSYRTSWDAAGKWDEPLCLAIKAWATAHAPPDGSQAWEDALMAVALPAATLTFWRPAVLPVARRGRTSADAPATPNAQAPTTSRLDARHWPQRR